MSNARLVIGDTRDVTATLEDGSVDLILTSPPFLALRSYLPADHPDKGKEIGSEASPADFLDVLLDLTVEWRRVLAPHGSIVVELGDTYSGSGGAGTYDPNPESDEFKYGRVDSGRAHPIRNMHGKVQGGGTGWPLAKSLCGIPHLYHLSLAYGRNLLRPEHTIEPWRIRNVVAWCRPNPPVGALGDKFRPATSYLTVACVSGRRYFDLDAVRGEPSPNTHARTAKGVESRPRSGKSADRDGNWSSLPELAETAGAPPLDWWEIHTHPYPGSHYATWPPALLTRPILAMCPQRVCRVCGKPSERIVESERGADPNRPEPYSVAMQAQGQRNGWGIRTTGSETTYTTLGWTDCGHNAWRNGLVLDPFAGSGTTLAVATGHGRDALGIDLDSRNADLAIARCGMFLTVETFGQVPA